MCDFCGKPRKTTVFRVTIPETGFDEDMNLCSECVETVEKSNVRYEESKHRDSTVHN